MAGYFLDASADNSHSMRLIQKPLELYERKFQDALQDDGVQDGLNSSTKVQKRKRRCHRPRTLPKTSEKTFPAESASRTLRSCNRFVQIEELIHCPERSTTKAAFRSNTKVTDEFPGSGNSLLRALFTIN